MKMIMNTEEVDSKMLKVGDLLLSGYFKQIGIVIETGYTFLHQHPFIKIKWIEKERKDYYSCFYSEYRVKETIEKVYINNSEKYYRIVRY